MPERRASVGACRAQWLRQAGYIQVPTPSRSAALMHRAADARRRPRGRYAATGRRSLAEVVMWPKVAWDPRILGWPSTIHADVIDTPSPASRWQATALKIRYRSVPMPRCRCCCAPRCQMGDEPLSRMRNSPALWRRSDYVPSMYFVRCSYPYLLIPGGSCPPPPGLTLTCAAQPTTGQILVAEMPIDTAGSKIIFNNTQGSNNMNRNYTMTP